MICVTATSYSPALYYPNALSHLTAESVGDESMKYFGNVKKMIDSGAIVTIGSDWPTGSADANPLRTVQIMVTRKNPFGKWPDEVLGEPISLDDCLRATTLGGAYSMNKENEIGSVEPGKAADMIVLNQNLFTIDPMSLIDSKVVYTIFAGEIVYDAKSAPQ